MTERCSRALGGSSLGGLIMILLFGAMSGNGRKDSILVPGMQLEGKRIEITA